MSSQVETIIFRDHIPVAVVDDPMRWFHQEHSYSMDHGLEHEGYSLLEVSDSSLVGHRARLRGAKSWLMVSERRGYGLVGWLARTVNGLADMLDGPEGERLSQPFEVANVLTPFLTAIEEALNVLNTNDDGAIVALAGDISAWVDTVRTRYGIEA